MGNDIPRDEFTNEEYVRFSERLYECLEALKQQIHSDKFDRAPLHIGAELENYIVDDDGRPLCINREIIEEGNRQATGSPYTVELNQFNLEINFAPIAFSPFCFAELQKSIQEHFTRLGRIAKDHQSHIVPIGILPTLARKDFEPTNMTDTIRYRALAKSLAQMRGRQFDIHIEGEDALHVKTPYVTYEGANTSLQFHLMVPKNSFASMFNAIQLTTPLLVAIGANSPIILNKHLWHETRIPLFKQSIDCRARKGLKWEQPSRVSFGHGWVRRDAWELFAETVSLYPPLFPLLSDESPSEAIANGNVPTLEELNIHMGTTWAWNRPIYSHADNGHIRIELRALPAGPSIIDMVSNVALAAGLAFGLHENIDDLLSLIPFKFVDFNFNRAAQDGLLASLVWPNTRTHQLREVPVGEIIEALLPTAEKGLDAIGIDPGERRIYLANIEKRIAEKRNGAIWQRRTAKHYETKLSRKKACAAMFRDYRENFESGAAVVDWR